jgi:hypothetical protein
MVEAGADLSRLDPPPDSSFWQPGGPIALRSVETMSSQGGAGAHADRRAHFPERRATFRRVHLSRARPWLQIELRDDDPSNRFRLTVAPAQHAKPTVDALLATLGFNTGVSRYVRDLRIDFAAPAQLEGLRLDWQTEQERRPARERLAFGACFDEHEDAGGSYLIAREGVLEWLPREMVRIGPWPSDDNGHASRREVRALALFGAWVGATALDALEGNELAVAGDTPRTGPIHHLHQDTGPPAGRSAEEQAGALPWHRFDPIPAPGPGASSSASLPSSLGGTLSYADARWMARQIAQLTRRQLDDAVALGHWPPAAGRLFGEKLAHRRNELVVALDLLGDATPSGPIALLPVDRELTTADGTVRKGEIVGRAPGATRRALLDPLARLLGSLPEIASEESYRSMARAETPSSPDGAPRITVELVERDADTSSEELAAVHLGFVDELAAAGEPDRRRAQGILFTPELHSESGHWGTIVSRITVGIEPAALEALLAIDPSDYWPRLAERLGYDDARLRRYRRDLKARGKDGLTRARRVPMADRPAIRRSSEMLRLLRRARTMADTPDRYDVVVEAMVQSAFRRAQGFDPRVLAVVREILGARAVSIDARITQQVWEGTRLPGGIDLVLHTHQPPGGTAGLPKRSGPPDADAADEGLDASEAVPQDDGARPPRSAGPPGGPDDHR